MKLLKQLFYILAMPFVFLCKAIARPFRKRSIYESMANTLSEGIPYRPRRKHERHNTAPYVVGGCGYSYQEYIKTHGSLMVDIKSWSRDPQFPDTRKIRNEWRWKMGKSSLKEQSADEQSCFLVF